MQSRCRNIILAGFLVLMLSFPSCVKREKVIPRRTMSSIYASMCMADLWLGRNTEERFVADTTDFYGAVFHAYGYDYDDFRRSVDHYLRDPERFAKILRISTTMLKKRAKILSENVEYLDMAYNRRALSFKIAPKPLYFDTLFLKPTLTDTLDIQKDKNGALVPVRVVMDTSFYGPHMFVRQKDTLEVEADSAKVELDTRGSMLVVSEGTPPKAAPRKSGAPLTHRRTQDNDSQP